VSLFDGVCGYNVIVIAGFVIKMELKIVVGIFFCFVFSCDGARLGKSDESNGLSR
jgi:hypothetical protein